MKIWYRFWVSANRDLNNERWVYADSTRSEESIRNDAEFWANREAQGCEYIEFGFEKKDPPQEYLDKQITSIIRKIHYYQREQEFLEKESLRIAGEL